jgi:hypothetical protein
VLVCRTRCCAWVAEGDLVQVIVFVCSCKRSMHWIISMQLMSPNECIEDSLTVALALTTTIHAATLHAKMCWENKAEKCI